MNLRARFADLDDAAKVGVVLAAAVAVLVLLVVLTVILAAVIGAFVLGVGADASHTPEAAFSFEADGDRVAVTHVGGDTIDAGQLVVSVGGTDRTWAALAGTDTVRTGDRVAVPASSGTTIRVVYRGDGGPVTLGRHAVE